VFLAAGVLLAMPAVFARERAGQQPAPITIDYPQEGSVFPPEITPPLFIWRDEARDAARWRIEIEFAGGGHRIRASSNGPRPEIGAIDPECVAATNKPPQLTPEQERAHTWRPDDATWNAIKRHSVRGPASITITGFGENDARRPLSRGRVSISTSKDPVGAPVFYRDVPLMPSETEKGVIKPLAPDAIKLIQWRLREIGERRSRVVLEKMPTCANCHSFSLDGRSMGMDMDGPGNDKGLYALVPLKPETVIGAADMVSWNPSQDRQVGLNRVGFMSQVSPDGRYVLTTVTRADGPPQSNFYVVNFKDYRFLQVFYPTIGILAWYSRETGRRHPLPGADDPRYVQTDGVWSPDGKYIVFARAGTREPYPKDGKMADYANDPKEVQIQYDLYRVPFNEGRGGQPEPIAGASANGMSNNFPKVSPDGRWIVFVQCRNGQLMRPDSQLYIVPVEGGTTRRMRANTALMNSWHSFSPNGRWMVFASKARSPYTQMYLTHIAEDGDDSPAILIENATAANRAVNLPEFVNIPRDGLVKISTPAVEVYRQFDQALELDKKGQYEGAIALWNQLLATDPDDARMLTNRGAVLAKSGRLDEAIRNYERALELNPQLVPAQTNLARALMALGRLDDAIPRLRAVLELHPESADLHNTLGRALAMKRQFEDAAAEFAKAVEIKPDFVEARHYLGMSLYYSPGKVREALAQWRETLRVDPNCVPALDALAHALATAPAASDRDGAEAVKLAERAVELSGGRDPAVLDTLGAAYAEAGKFPEAVAAAARALELAARQNRAELVEDLKARIRLYEAKTPYRSTPESER
jgi:tetratricopeptide (TPR) repeat protein/Tol biopolymer transport system component